MCFISQSVRRERRVGYSKYSNSNLSYRRSNIFDQRLYRTDTVRRAFIMSQYRRAYQHCRYLLAKYSIKYRVRPALNVVIINARNIKTIIHRRIPTNLTDLVIFSVQITNTCYACSIRSRSSYNHRYTP